MDDTQKISNAIYEAIVLNGVSPAVVQKVILFAEERGTVFISFNGKTGCFHFSNGEAFKGDIILKHYGIEPPEEIYIIGGL